METNRFSSDNVESTRNLYTFQKDGFYKYRNTQITVSELFESSSPLKTRPSATASDRVIVYEMDSTLVRFRWLLDLGNDYSYPAIRGRTSEPSRLFQGGKKMPSCLCCEIDGPVSCSLDIKDAQHHSQKLP